MDSSSMPPQETVTTDSAIHTGAEPVVAKPPSAVHSTRPGAGWPGIPTNTRIAPIRMNTNTAITLIEDRKNSITDRKSTRLNSSHVAISYAVFCLKKTNDITHYSG